MGQALHGLALPDGGVAVDVVDDLGREHKEAAVDPGAIAVGLFLEAEDSLVVEAKRTEATRGLGSGECGELAVLLMEGDQGGDVDVADAVAIGEAEVVAIEVGPDALESAAGHGLLAGVDEGDTPGLGVLLMDLHAVGAQVEGDVGHVQEVVGEVLLDHVALVAAADDEVIDAVGGVELHDVPKDRLAADLHHGLGLEIGLLGQACAEATGKDDGFHIESFSLMSRSRCRAPNHHRL